MPEGWEQVDLIETFTIGSPLPYGENNPYIRAKREKEARENSQAIGCCIAMVVAVILFVMSVVASV